MSFQIDLQFDPDPPRKAEPLKVYANVTLLEQTRCEGYRIDFTLTHPSGQQHHDSKHCNGLDPQTNEWHQLLESFPEEDGEYHLEMAVSIDNEIKAMTHTNFTISS